MWASVAQGGLVLPVLFSRYVDDIPTPSRQVELAQYVNDTALVATFRSPSLFVGCLESNVGRLERDYGTGGWPSTSRKAPLCSLLRPRGESKIPDQCSFSERQCSGSKQYGILGWPLIHSLPDRHTSIRWERRQLKCWACLTPSLTGEAACQSETVCCSIGSSSYDGLPMSDLEIRCQQPYPEASNFTIQVSSHCD
jgi:hypothetical protein